MSLDNSSGPATTVHEAFAESAAIWPGHDFFHVPLAAAKGYSATPVNWTYGAAAIRVAELRAAYGACGLKAGHRVALLLDNRAEFFLHHLALNGLGVSVVPLHGEATPSEMAHILRDSQAVLTVAWPERRALLERALAKLDDVPPQAWAGDGEATLPRVQAPATAAADEAALLYTSGSTGDPKGCIISNAYMLTMGRRYVGMGGLCRIDAGQDRLITPLPLVHMNALVVSAMAMILSGGCIVQLDRFHPATWWRSVRESRATIVHYLGVMPAMLLQADPSELDTQHSVKFGFGAGVHPKHHAAFEARFGFPLVESWSMTEVGAGAVVSAQHEPRHVGSRCFGKPEPFMQWRIVDEQGRDVAAGEPGELWVRAAGADPRAGFFSGYANQPELTAVAWAHDYFHTGDIVRAGADGSLHFVDRKKSIIRRSGENIASLEVEAVLNQLAMVKGVGVGPVDDEIRGEEVMACIELADGSAPSEETARAIVAAAAERLAYFKVPGYVAFVEQLPLTASQKLQRGVLKDLSRQRIERGTVFDLRGLKKRRAAEQGE